MKKTVLFMFIISFSIFSVINSNSVAVPKSYILFLACLSQDITMTYFLSFDNLIQCSLNEQK